MKLCTSLAAAFLIVIGGLATAQAQNTLYWDINGTDPGATFGDGIGDGDWDTATPNWNPMADGTGTPTVWTAGDHAVFAAGDDLGTDPSTAGALLTVIGTQTAGSVLVEEGYVEIISGTVDTGTNAVTINTGATFAINSTLRLNAGGKVVLSGGHLRQTNMGNAGSFINPNKAIEIDGTGIVSYDDGSDTNVFVSVYNGVIGGVGGTTTNGGTGTLIKRGPDRFGAQGGQANYAFSKLIVEEGLYQIRSPSGGVDTGLGAVPLALLPDAVTLDGGQIGSNGAITIHANRGVTIGPQGGTYNGVAAESGGGVFTQLSPLSGSGTFTLTGAASSGFRIGNADSVNTFTGGVVVDGGVLFLDESLSPAALNGTGGAVTVAADKTLTVGSGNGFDSYAGDVNGDGGLTKVGTGTQTLTGNATEGYAGNTRVEGGTLSIANPYLADSGDVYLSTGAMLNLNFSATDMIGSLFIDGMAQQIGLWGAVGNAGADFTTSLITGNGLLDVTMSGMAGLPGDYNQNGIVDAADYTVWQNRFGDSASLPNDDTPGVGQDDFDRWKMHFGDELPGSGAAVSAGAVPEPASTILALLAAVAAVAACRRR